MCAQTILCQGSSQTTQQESASSSYNAIGPNSTIQTIPQDNAYNNAQAAILQITRLDHVYQDAQGQMMIITMVMKEKGYVSLYVMRDGMLKI